MSEWLSGDFRKDLNKEYLGHWDLPEGEDLIVTIEGVKMGTVRNQRGSETKPILHFQEEGVKPLILNVVNQKSITKAVGSPKRENWRGKKIALFEGREPKADDGLAVRIRDYAPKVVEAICEECGQYLRPVKANGRTYNVAQIKMMSEAAYEGQCLCWDCASARRKQESKAEKVEGAEE